jgi:hypothetical protein
VSDDLLRRDTVGIVPAGALGVAFFYYLTDRLQRIDGSVALLERTGSASGSILRQGGVLRVQTAEGLREIWDAQIWQPDLIECAGRGSLPEILLVCTQPDQLLQFLASVVRLLETLHAAGREIIRNLPTLILCSNGIYFQRTRQFLLEKLEEATLLGRLPDLWPVMMPMIIGKLLRGVTIQTGHREGAGADAIYRPGSRGRTRLAGGDPEIRARASDLLSHKGGWFEVAPDPSPTRAEFDKALVNLTVNLLGQLRAIDDSGEFRLLTVREILTPDVEEEARTLVKHVVAIGQAVHAYAAQSNVEKLFAETMESCREHLDHAPSSLQWIEQQLRLRRLQPRITPTETWLLEPLIRYAHAAGLEKEAHYFEQLTRRLERRLSLAIARRNAGELRLENRRISE